MVLGAQREPSGPPLLGIIRNIPGNKFLGLGTRSAASRAVKRPKPVKIVAIFWRNPDLSQIADLANLLQP